MRTLAITISITGAKVSAVSSTGMPSMCATIMAESVDEAVRVARCIPSLEAGLVHSAPTEVVAVRVEDLVPRRVERVGEIHAPTIAAHLDHLGRARQSQLRGDGVRAAIHDAAQTHRTRLFRVVRIADVVLF